jgi:hypothetical protein
LFPSIVLAILVMAFGAGCDGERVSIAPRDEPTVVQTHRDGENEPAGALTLGPLGEAEAMTATPTPEATGVELPAGAEALVTLAQQDLARRLDLAPEAIRVVSVEPVEWSDTSLGCPQPGLAYVQVTTPGFRVMLEAEGHMYEYHTDKERTAILCEEEVSAMEVLPVPGTVEPGLERLVTLAKEDLAQTLSIPVEEIEVLEAKSVVWPDGGLGCPEPGIVYTQVPREGVLIRLRAGERIFSYHGGGGTAPFLCRRSTRDTSTRD